MKRLLVYLLGLITSFSLGVNYIEPQEKVFMKDEYYKGSQLKDTIDYRKMYNQYQGGTLGSIKECDKMNKPLESGEKLFAPKSEKKYRWFWASNQDEKTIWKLLSQEKELNDTYLFEVPKGTKLVSPANSYIANGNRNAEGLFPERDFTKGVNLSLVIVEEKRAFRITYQSMEKLWCCMSKTEPDSFYKEDKNLPIYGHTISLSNKDTFVAGAVVGISGVSGIPTDKRKDKSFIVIKIEKSNVSNGSVDENWESSTIKEFYGI